MTIKTIIYGLLILLLALLWTAMLSLVLFEEEDEDGERSDN